MVEARIDTMKPADSVEFCPIPGFTQHLVIGTYELQNDKRIGNCLLLDTKLKLIQKLETAAILDCKWSYKTIDSKAILGCVTADGETLIYELGEKLELKCSINNTDSITTSLDWQNRLHDCGHNLITSCTDGSIQYIKTTESSLVIESSWQAHGFEAWIAAFDYHDLNRAYTGGDDCLFKIWDLRSGLGITNKQ